MPAADLDPGQPIEVVVRVAEAPAGVTGAGGCIVKNGNRTIRVVPDRSKNFTNPDDEFEFSDRCIYEPQPDVPNQNPEVFEDHVAWYVHQFVDALNCTVLALGESKTGKSSFMVGEAGMLQQAASLTLDLCQTKGKESDGRYDRELRLSMFEIYEEEIRDLSAPQAPILGLMSTAGRSDMHPHLQGGTWVEGLGSKTISEAAQVQRELDKARSNAKQHVTDFGPGSHFTSTFYVLDLKQKVREIELVSRLIFIELAGAEKLERDLSELQMKEGNALNKSIISFGAVVRELEQDGQPALVNWEQSKLTMLMREALSSNCMTLAVAMLAPWHYPESKVTLQYGIRLKQLRTFPVRGDPNQRGLLRGFREELLQLREDLRAAESANEKHETRSLLLKIKKVENEAIELTGEKAKLLVEKDQLFDRFRSLRDRFNQVVDDKVGWQEKMIVKEEEFLTVSKALLDMEVEMTQFKEMAESSKFDVQNKLLTAENQLVEYEMRIEEMTRGVDKMADEMKNTIEENKQLKLELVAMKENCQNSQKDLVVMTDKKDDISLETINLMNAKKDLKQANDALTAESAQKAAEITRLNEQLDKTKDDYGGKEERVERLKEEVENLKEQLHRAQHELDTKSTEFEAGKVTVEQRFLADTREKDMEIMVLKERFDDERKKTEMTRKQMEDQITDLQRMKRNEGHRADGVQVALDHAQKDEQAAQEANNDLQRRLLETGDEYRTKLRKCMEDLVDMQKTVKDSDPASASSQLQAGMDSMMQDVIHSHMSKEAELVDVTSKYKERITDLVARNHRYAQAHLKCREMVFELAPPGQVPEVDSVEDLNTEFQGEVEKNREREVIALQERLKEVEKELIQNQQVAMDMNGNYQKSSRELVEKIQYMTREIDELKHANDAVTREKEALQRGMDAAGADTKQILQLEKESLAAVNAIREGGIEVKERHTGDVNYEDVRLESQLHQLMDEKAQLLELIEHKNQEMSRAIQDQNELRRVRLERDHLVQQMQVITGGDNTRQRLSDMVVQLQSKLKERGDAKSDGGDTGSSDLRKEMREFALTKQKELEKERAELKMKLTMAEVKLKGMEEYMDKTIKEYQIEIVNLRNMQGRR